jgi:6,7-dimethyl-8-ribityllumazine synthase
VNKIQAEALPGDVHIAIVTSRFNDSVTKLLHEGALMRLQELGVDAEAVEKVWVPGAVEIPLVAQRLAAQKKYDAIICLGAVIRGETTHYDYVCEQVSQGCQHVALRYDVPVIFGVLTTENEAQALDRLGGSKGHKGRDAADAAYEMISVMRQL